ncbi:DUF4169 family protein [Sneathiella sp. HT1-7]|uniref:DUF4169 family protein n=1 Tax=Sneathiella sp. HT1-7 TaxID=2887192 RepID=UPI001D14DF2B|nr:DUF4169 family protein [Sneathiella sp. HT1-7]MCC3306513.1 DUF4169 family protein [Sneathiella sp. HT1-7]
MGDIVNLNQFRKERNRKAAEDLARNNRASFGRTSAQKKKDLDKKKKRDALLDQKKLPGQSEEDTPSEN